MTAGRPPALLVQVPLWIGTYGTCTVLIAAPTRQQAQAIAAQWDQQHAPGRRRVPPQVRFAEPRDLDAYRDSDRLPDWATHVVEATPAPPARQRSLL